jgi:hypothetical protein
MDKVTLTPVTPSGWDIFGWIVYLIRLIIWLLTGGNVII